VEGVCERDDVEQRDIALAPLDSANVVAMEVCQFGKFFLGKALLKAELAHVNSERSFGICGPHAAIIVLMTTMSLHTMSVIDWRMGFATS